MIPADIIITLRSDSGEEWIMYFECHLFALPPIGTPVALPGRPFLFNEDCWNGTVCHLNMASDFRFNVIVRYDDDEEAITGNTESLKTLVEEMLKSGWRSVSQA